MKQSQLTAIYNYTIQLQSYTVKVTWLSNIAGCTNVSYNQNIIIYLPYSYLLIVALIIVLINLTDTYTMDDSTDTCELSSHSYMFRMSESSIPMYTNMYNAN